VTPGISTRCSSRSVANCVISGGLLTRKACPVSGAQPMSEASALAEANASPKAPTFGGYGDTIDILVQKRRNKKAAKRFFRKLLKGQCVPPWRLVTDKLKGYSAAHREILPSVTHSTKQYENNRAELSHEPTRQRERQMRRFKSMGQAQRFLAVHGTVGNLFRLGRHLIRATHYREFRAKALSEWQQVTCAC